MKVCDLPPGGIFVYCDDPSHPKRVVAVGNCYPRDGEPRWEVLTTSPGAPTLGIVLVDDQPLTRKARGARRNPNEDVRWRWRLECRKCGDKTAVVARQEKFFQLLDVLAENGVSKISLAGVAATVGGIST